MFPPTLRAPPVPAVPRAPYNSTLTLKLPILRSSSAAFYCTLIASWYVSLGSVYFVLALLMAIASKAALFASSSFLLLLLGFWLSLIAFMAFSFAVHTLFSK